MNATTSTIFGIVCTAIGAAASWYFSRAYYVRSGIDLDAAIQLLKGDNQKQLQAANAIGRMLEQGGMGKPSYDAAGNLTGIVITGQAHMTTSSFLVNATGTVTPPPQFDRQHEQP